MTIQSWMKEEFLPWKKSMESFKNERAKNEDLLKNNVHELKYIVALLLEKREAEAVKIWNNLGLKPTLVALTLNLRKDALVMTTSTGQEQCFSARKIIEDLQAVLTEV